MSKRCAFISPVYHHHIAFMAFSMASLNSHAGNIPLRNENFCLQLLLVYSKKGRGVFREGVLGVEKQESQFKGTIPL